jgi:predicted MFS family arabinose efflux permease
LRLLAILALINFVNFADRFVIAPLFPLLRYEFFVGDRQLGSLQTWLLVVLALTAIPSGLLADRISRTRIIAIGVVFWSLATFLTGFAPTFSLLLLARGLVGVGEAAYGPAAQSMISASFPAGERARAQAVFAAGMLTGGAVGQALGGVIGEGFGWRPAFFCVGIPGLLLGLTVLHLKEPPRGQKMELLPVWRLLGVPAYLALIASGVLITFASISFLTWGTDFAIRYKGFGLREASVLLGSIGLLAFVLGALSGGYVADLAQRRQIYGRAVTVAVAFLAAAPFILWALYAEEKGAVLAAFFLAAFFMSWYHGPVTAIIHDLMPRRAHATSVALYMSVTQLVGAFGPRHVGRISDLRDLQAGLQVAVGVMVLGALGFFLVGYLIRRHGTHHPLLEPYHVEQT